MNPFSRPISLILQTALMGILITACHSEGKKSSLHIQFDEVSEETQVVLTGLSQELPYADTLVLAVGEKTADFTLRLKIPAYFSLQCNQKNPVTLLIYPGERIRIQASSPGFQSWSLKGSEATENIKMLSEKLERTLFSIDSLNHLMIQYVDNKNFENIRVVVEMNHNRIVGEQRDFSIDFIKQNLGSMESLFALYQQYPGSDFILNRKEDLIWFEKTDSALYKKYPESSYVQMLHANVAEFREQLRIEEIAAMVSGLGSEAPEIVLPDPEGNRVRLSSLRGKYVLLDFWAAWCSPCREENPNLVTAYRQYADKGFDIFQVSLDRNKAQWVEGIRQDGLGRWKHGSDLQYWNSPVAETYNIEEIPANFLLDPEGIIVAKNLRGEALIKKLEEIFAQPQ